jgi:perosamine synthetase
MSPSEKRTKEVRFCEPWFAPAYANRVRDQILDGWVGPGPTTSEFAAGLAAYSGSKHCLLTTSGTVALSVAAVALGLLPGDEILVPAYGVISTINAFAVLGLRPRLVDVERATGCMSPADLRTRISQKTRAVCFVNFSGYTGENLFEVARICKEKGIPLIEDAACAFGHHYQGRSAGSFGGVGIFSFSVPKIITTGQGGAVVTDSPELFEKAQRYIDHGASNWRKTNLVLHVGTNLRYNDILAAFGLAQLGEIELRLARKRAAHEALRSALGDKLYAVPDEAAPLYNIVFTPERARLLSFLRERGIEAADQYRTISEHPPYAELRESGSPNADFWTRHATYLPFGMALEADDARWIGECVLESRVPLLSILKGSAGTP